MTNSNMLSAMSTARVQKWREKHILAVAHQVTPGELESLEEWSSEVLKSAEENMAKERDERLAIYSAINLHFRREDYDERFDPYVHACVAGLKEFEVWGSDVGTSKSFAGCYLEGCKGGTYWMIEVKLVDDLSKQLVYEDRTARLSAHASDSIDPDSDPRLAHLFISTTSPGQYKLVEYTTEQKQRGWELFLAAKRLWEVSNANGDRIESGLSNAELSGGEKNL